MRLLRFAQGSGWLWAVGTQLKLRVREYHLKVTLDNGAERVHKWTVLGWDGMQPVKVLVWVVLQDERGSYGITACRIDGSSPTVPHLTTGSACVAVGDAPRVVDGVEALEQLGQGMARAFQVVNLSSMYNMVPTWRETFREYIPEVMKEAVFGSGNQLAALRQLARAEIAARTAQRGPTEHDGEVWMR